MYLALLGISIKPKQQLYWSYWDSDGGCFWSTTWRKFRSLVCLLSFCRQEFSHVLHHCCHVSFEARHWSVIPPNSHPPPSDLQLLQLHTRLHQYDCQLRFCGSSSSVHLLDQLRFFHIEALISYQLKLNKSETQKSSHQVVFPARAHS